MTKEDEHRLQPEKFRGLIRFRRNSFDASRRIIYILDVQRSSTRARIHSRNADLNISAIFFVSSLPSRWRPQRWFIISSTEKERK